MSGTTVSDALLERDLQAKCVAWWNGAGLPGILFHVPNEGKRSRLEAAALRALGVVAGAPDFVLLLPRGRVHLIELKAENGTQSPEQIAFESSAEDLDHTYSIVYTLAHFVADVCGAARWWSDGEDGHRQPVASSVVEIGQAFPLP